MAYGWNRLHKHGCPLNANRNCNGSVRLGLAGTLSLITVIVGSPVTGQIVPDNTLGAENSVVVPNVTIRGVVSDRIDGGAIRGPNLFHSFLQFSINEGRGAYFSNPTGVENILSRVTGGDPSRIMGRLGVLGNANLFLLNPNGILFGPNASLDVQGSFVASTASAIQLGENGQFSATDPASSTLLAVQPGALFLNALTDQATPTATGAPARGEIVNQGNLNSGQDLTLFANHLTLQGQLQAGRDLTLQATNTLQIRDHATVPFIAQSGRDLLVQGNQRVDIFALNHPNSGLFSGRDMVLRSPNPIIGDAHYWSGGNFRIERLDGSPGSLISPNDPVIRTSGNVTLDDYTGTSLHIFAGGSVTILGDITITGPDTVNGIFDVVTLSDGTTVFIDGAVDPVLDIRAGTTNFGTEGLTPTPFPGPGNFISGGSISTPASSADITVGRIFNLSGGATGTGQILLTNQYNPNPNLTGSIETGQILAYGNVNIDSQQNIRTTGLIDTTIANQNGGDIRMLAGGTLTAEGNLVSSVTAGEGVAGDIILKANGDVQTRNVIAASNTNTPFGFATIRIESLNNSVFLNDVRVVSSNTGTGFAGDIFIDAFDTVEIIDSSVESIGNFGRIFVGKNSSFGDNIYPDNVIIRKSSLTATNSGTGTGGLVDVAAWINIDIDNAAVQTTSSGQANGGRVNLLANFGNITLTGSSLVDASISGIGNGSSSGVEIAANNGTVSLDSNSQITTATTGTAFSASGGPISITANRLALSENSALNATTSGAAPGGNITINTNNGSVELDTSSLINTAVQPGGTARGGDITIDTGLFSLIQGGRVQTRTLDSGDSGDIQLNFTNTATIAGLDNASLLYSGMSSDTASTGTGGNITINSAANRVGNLTLSGGAFLSARTTDTAFDAGDGGDIAINVNNFSVLTGGQVLTTSTGDGDAGDISVNAAGAVNIAGSRNPLPRPNSPFTTLPTLISLDGVTFSAVADPNVEQSGPGGIPFVSIQRDGAGAITANAAPLGSSNTVDYYQFTVTSDGSRAIFDIDNAISNPISAVDTELFLFDALTGQLLASNDDFYPANNGSTSGFDSRIAYNFNSAGTYVLGVGQYNTTAANGTLVTGTPLAPNDPYLLQVSLQNQGLGTFNVGDRNPNQGVNSGLFSNTQPLINVRTPGDGAGGNITITTQTGPIALTDGGIVNASTASLGAGGNVLLQTSGGPVSITGGGRVETRTSGVGDASSFGGDAGNIVVNAPDITISGQTQLNGQPVFSGLLASSDTAKSGQGGSITINSEAAPGDRLLIENGAFLSTLNRSDQSGQGIAVYVNRLDLQNGGQVITAAEGRGDAGDILVRSPNITISGTTGSPPPGNIANGGLSLNSNEAIDYSTLVPYQTVSGNNGQVNYYTFNVPAAGNRAVFDVDNASNGFNDTELFLFRYDAAANQSVFLARNDDSRPEGGDRGSTSLRDSYLDYQFDQPGTYILAVAPYSFDTTFTQGTSQQPSPGLPTVNPNPGVLNPAQQYTLQISLDQRNTFNPNASASSGLFAQSNRSAAGNITVIGGGAGQVTLSNSAQISAETNTGGAGDPANITLQGLQTLTVNNSLISSSTNSGVAGSVTVNAGSQITLDGTFNNNGLVQGGIRAAAEQGGNAGSITLDTPTLIVRNGAAATVSSMNGAGTAGDLNVTASTVALSNNARLEAETDQGSGGDIQLRNLQTLQVQNSLISASTRSGTAGDVIVNAGQSVELRGLLANGTRGGILAEATVGGNAGGVRITTPVLRVLDGAQATVSSTGAGFAGNLEVSATAVTLDNNGLLAANTEQGSGGNIQLRNLQTLQVVNGSQVSASTVDGQGGFLRVNAARSIELRNGGGLFAQAAGNGNAGDLAIATGTFTVTNGAQATVSSRGTGSAGTLTVSAGSIRLENSGRLTADTILGSGGNINIVNVDQLQLNNLGEISTSTVNGQAGTLTVQANALISSRGRISSRSDGSGNAGLIRLDVDNYAATNNGEIRASSQGGGGGRIEINAREIFLTGSSPIISSVFDGRGGGGSIIINSNLFIALQDSDILANAVDGRGGEIRINSPVFVADIFANVGRNPGRELSRWRNNGRVDISASSRVDTGSVNVPDFSFLQNSLSSLAANFVDPDQVVAGSCIARRNVEQGSFTVTGVGGLPNTPYDAIAGRYNVSGVQSLPGVQTSGEPDNENVVTNRSAAQIPNWRPGDLIQEAQGMMALPNGRMVLGTLSQLAEIAKVDDLICHPVTAPSVSARDTMENRSVTGQGLGAGREQERQGI